MSGHNKWSSIKHKKAAVDAKRGKLFTRIIRELTVAARSGGGDPSGNPRLRTAMLAARDANMPKDTMTNAIKRGTGELEGVSFEEITYEGYGPGGAALLIDVVTDNRNRAVSEIRAVFTKSGGNLGESGSVGWMFDKKGLISVEFDGGEDGMMEHGLEAGAEDVQAEGPGHYLVTCLPEALENVRKFLEDKNLRITRAEIARVPKTTVALGEQEGETLLRLISRLEELDDVQNVFSNYAIEDAVLERIAARI